MRHHWPVPFLLLVCWTSAHGNPIRDRPLLKRTSKKLAGQVLDYTNNHGSDNRIWSAALCQKRDLYVYLPPCYDPKKPYPLMLWLHGLGQDEVAFLEHVAPVLDTAIASGKLPPMIIAAPDGTIKGRNCLLTNTASFYLNTKAGKFEDYLMQDVWDFLHEQFLILPEREAHIIAGVSMGGGAAYNKALKYPERFKIVFGIFPPLNTRWENSRGRYRANFDPNDWNFRTDFSRRRETIARYGGIITVRLGQILRPLYDIEPETTEKIAAENPLELMVNRGIKDGDLAMFVAYGGRDEFNMDAQIESFLYVAHQLGIHVTVAYDPKGHHNRRTALKFIPSGLDWLEVQMAQCKKH
jgi:S-formylglutathione hydrolase FrmB